MRLKPVADQVIVITGGSSGIGLLTARAAASRGAKVVLVARNGDVLQAEVAAIEAAGGKAAHAVADVGDREQLARAADHAVARFGRIDSWVNNAGVAIYAELLNTPLDEHRRLFATNYFGVVNGAQVAVPQLKKQGGALVTVGSIASDMPSPVMGVYAASKHAVKAFVEALRIELQAERAPISVTLIKPSGMATPIAEHAANHREGSPKIPPPVYDPQLVADAILDACETSFRDRSVGGVGRLQTMFANHFPALFERLAPAVMPLLRDRTRPDHVSDNLFVAGKDGAPRAKDETGRKVSLYSLMQRNKLTIATIIGVTLLSTALLRRRR